ncbi:MAG: SCO family protein [Flavobacteriaceae bacterium]|nr:SCO family protein [Flavobacteriaceae bacterium]
MKNKSYIGISLMILVFGIYALPKLVNSISNNDVIKKSKRLDKISSEKKKSSLLKFEKVPEFSFINQDEKTISNKDYANKVYVVEFFFTNCPTICPKMNENMVKIQNVYKDNPNFGIASFSIDPERDSPKILKKYAEVKGATMKNWHFLNGNIDTIYKLSNKGFKLFAGKNTEAEGGFEHSGLFALIDKSGYIRSRTVRKNGFENPIKFYDALDIKQINWLKEDIALLLQE